MSTFIKVVKFCEMRYYYEAGLLIKKILVVIYFVFKDHFAKKTVCTIFTNGFVKYNSSFVHLKYITILCLASILLYIKN